jgi:ABC-type branched-subunit amino acid transport system ATPase component
MIQVIAIIQAKPGMRSKILDFLHGYVLESGRVSISGSAQELAGDVRIQQAYLGHGD